MCYVQQPRDIYFLANCSYSKYISADTLHSFLIFKYPTSKLFKVIKIYKLFCVRDSPSRLKIIYTDLLRPYIKFIFYSVIKIV